MKGDTVGPAFPIDSLTVPIGFSVAVDVHAERWKRQLDDQKRYTYNHNRE